MTDKRITFSASLQAQEFNRELDRIEKRLKGVGRGGPGGMAVGLSQMQPQLRALGVNMDKATSSLLGGKAKQGMKDFDTHVKKQIRDLGLLQRIEDRRATQIKDFKEQLKGLTQGTEQYKNLHQQIFDIQEKQTKTLTTQEAKLTSLLKSGGALKQLTQQMIARPEDFAADTRLGKATGALLRGGRRLGRGMAGVAAAIIPTAAAGAEYFAFQAQRPLIQARAEAQVTRGVQLTTRRFLEGRGAEEQLLLRTGIIQKSLNQAKEVIDAERKKDLLRATAGIAGVGLAAATGAGLGAKAGAVIGGAIAPGAGMAPGAVIGAGLGGITAGGFSLFRLMQTRSGRSLLDRSTYNKEINALTLERYQEFREQNKESIHFQTRALNYIKDRSPSYLRGQRTLGFGDIDLFGGTVTAGPMADPTQAFRQRRVRGILDQPEGFVEQEVLQTAQGIAGIGGARGIRENVTAALRARRNRNILAPEQIIGRLQAIGEARGTGAEQFKKILAEGFTIGLDNSNMAREQERFANIVAQSVFQQGRGTDAGQMAAFFKTIAGDQPTMRALQGAQDAAGGLRSLTRNPAGVRGMVQAAAIETAFGDSGDIFSKLALQNTDMRELVAGSNRVSQLAREFGFRGPEAVKQFQEKAIKAKLGGVTITTQARNILNEIKGGKLTGEALQYSKGRLGTILEGTSSVFGELDNEARAGIINMLAGSAQEGGIRRMVATRGVGIDLGRGPGVEKIGDVAARAEASRQQANRQLFLENQQQIRTAFESAGKMAPLLARFGDRLTEQLEKINASGDGAAEALAGLVEQMNALNRANNGGNGNGATFLENLLTGGAEAPTIPMQGTKNQESNQ